MALGIVSDEDFDKELKDTSANAEHINMNKGRGNRSEIPEEIREIIAEEAINGAPAKLLSEAFGVSESSISAYKNGATSTSSYHEPNEKLQKKNDQVRQNIIGTARSRLLQALDHITPEKMADAKLRDVASVAKDMSAIVANMEPQVSNQNIGAQFVFHVPKQKRESDFEIIEVTK